MDKPLQNGSYHGSNSEYDYRSSRGRREQSRVLPTTQHLGDVARTYLSDLEKRMKQSSPEIFEVWPLVAGEFARMTRAKKFERGVLYVIVNNSALMSILHTKKAELLSALRKRFSGTQIHDIMFRFGQI